MNIVNKLGTPIPLRMTLGQESAWGLPAERDEVFINRVDAGTTPGPTMTTVCPPGTEWDINLRRCDYGVIPSYWGALPEPPPWEVPPLPGMIPTGPFPSRPASPAEEERFEEMIEEERTEWYRRPEAQPPRAGIPTMPGTRIPFGVHGSQKENKVTTLGQAPDLAAAVAEFEKGCRVWRELKHRADALRDWPDLDDAPQWFKDYHAYDEARMGGLTGMLGVNGNPDAERWGMAIGELRMCTLDFDRCTASCPAARVSHPTYELPPLRSDVIRATTMRPEGERVIEQIQEDIEGWETEPFRQPSVQPPRTGIPTMPGTRIPFGGSGRSQKETNVNNLGLGMPIPLSQASPQASASMGFDDTMVRILERDDAENARNLERATRTVAAIERNHDLIVRILGGEWPAEVANAQAQAALERHLRVRARIATLVRSNIAAQRGNL